jgi:hypothetical protein
MALISGSDRTVAVSVQARTRVSPQVAFETVAPIDVASVYKRWGPFPATRLAKDQTGAWDAAGQTRTLILSDGTSLREHLLEYDDGHSFAYDATEITNALGKLVYGVHGDWSFIPDGSGTVMRWTWEFKPRPRCYVPVRLLLTPLFRNYMQAAVNNAAAIVNRSAH